MELKTYIKPTLLVTEDLQETLTISPENILSNPASVMIFGHAGSGKTSLLKYLLSKTDEIERTNIKVVYVKFRDFESHIEFAQKCTSVIENTAKDKLLYFLCDGLDEVRDSSLFISELKRLREHYPNVVFVVTARDSLKPEFEVSPFFKRLEISPLNEGEIREYLEKLFGENYSRIEANVKNSPEIKHILSNPFILEIFARVISEYDIAVDNLNPSALIDIFVQQSLSEFSKSRQQINVFHLNIDDKLQFLESFAFYCAVQKRHIIPFDEFIEKIVETFHDTTDRSNLVDSIIHLPLLSISRYGVSFSHMVVFEYFLARNMIRSTGKNEFSISIPTNGIRTKLYFSNPKSISDISNLLSNRLKHINAYNTGTEIFYAKAGSVELGIAIVLAPGVFYCFMKFADAFFKELGKISAQKITSSENSLSIPPYIESELPNWIMENEELKKEYLIELSKRYAGNTNIQNLLNADPDRRSKEIARIAVNLALEDNEKYLKVIENKKQ